MPLSVCVFCLCAPHDLVVPRTPLCPYLVFLFSLSPYLVSSVRVYLITSFTFCYLNPVFSTVQPPVLTSMLCFCVSLPVLCYPVLRRRKTVPLRFTLCLLAPHFNTVCNCDISHINVNINVSFPLPALLSTVDIYSRYRPLEILRNTEVNKGRLNNPRRRKKHRGRRAGIHNRLRKRAHSPPLPSILLANVQSLENKMDVLRARISFQRDIRDCNILCLTETWLKPSVPETAVTPFDNFSVLRMDRKQRLEKTNVVECV